jgi:PAS domain S-box-containing protein
MKLELGGSSADAAAAWDFEAFFEVSLDMLCVRDREARFVKVNRAWETSLGYSASELEGAYLVSLIHPDDLESTRTEMERVRTVGQGIPQFINRYRHRDGSYRHLEWRARQVGDFVFAAARDVTDRIAGEHERARLVARLEANRAQLSAVQTVAKIGSWEVDFQTGETNWSAEIHRIFETDPKKPPPPFSAILDIMHPDDREAAARVFSLSRQSPCELGLEYRLRLPGGRTRYVEERWQSYADDTGRPVRALGTCQDITERLEMQEANRLELESALSATQAILDNSYDAIITVDGEGRFVRVNRRAEQLWGYAAGELIGVPFIEVVHPDDRHTAVEVVTQVMAGTPVGGHNNRCVSKDGSILPMMWSATWSDAHRTIFAVARDMREHLSAEDRLRQSQKMAAVGRLTGGVAHDFNNLLTVIIGSTEELIAALSGDAELAALGRLSLEAAEQGADLVRRLLAYARNQPLASVAVDCNRMLESLQVLVRSTFTEDIEVAIEPAPDEIYCLADATQLTTALLNLCINARDAMPEGGRLTMRVERASPEPGAEAIPGEDTRSYAVFTVEDTGHGMSDETKAQAAEPFFTTKSVGQGSGLGLSTVYGFVSQSGGQLQIDSQSGAGARVSIRLPEAQPGPEPRPDAVERIEGPAAPLQARILLVEDDAVIRSQAERQLRSMGHLVIAAADGTEALARLVAGRFDLLLTDIVMPNGLSGHELAERARTIDPAIRILLSSGHSEDAVLRGVDKQIGVAFLPKPYRLAQLENEVSRLLRSRAGTSH